MKQSVTSAATSPRRTSHENEWLAAVLLFAGLTLLVSPMGGAIQEPNPPIQLWITVGLFSLAPIGLALWRSYVGRSRLSRWSMALAILLSLPGLLNPILSFYSEYSDFPWLVLTPMLIALIACAWLGRQYWLIAGVVLPVLYVSVAAYLPPNQVLPAGQTRDGITLTLQQLERDGSVVFCDFQIAGPKGEKLSDRFPLAQTEIEGHAAGIPYRTWRPHVWPDDDSRAYQANLSAYTFPPRWARGLDLTISVPAKVKTGGKPLVFHFTGVPNPTREHQSVGLDITSAG